MHTHGFIFHYTMIMDENNLWRRPRYLSIKLPVERRSIFTFERILPANLQCRCTFGERTLSTSSRILDIKAEEGWGEISNR